jgi:hypothetical protein
MVKVSIDRRRSNAEMGARKLGMMMMVDGVSGRCRTRHFIRIRARPQAAGPGAAPDYCKCKYAKVRKFRDVAPVRR